MQSNLISQLREYIRRQTDGQAQLKSPRIEAADIVKMKPIDSISISATEAALLKCEQLIKECNDVLEPLEERLRNTPKPSQELGW